MSQSPTVMDTQTVCQNDTTSTCKGQNHWTDGQNDTRSSSGQNQQTDGQNDIASSSGQNQQTDSQNDTASSSGQNQWTDGQNDTASSSGQNQWTDGQKDTASSSGQTQQTDGQNDTASSSGQTQQTDSQNDTATSSGQTQQTDSQNDTATSSGQNQQTDGQNDTASSSGQNHQTDGQNDTASFSGQNQLTDGWNDTASSSGQNHWTAGQNDTASSSGQNHWTAGQNDTASSSCQNHQTDVQYDTTTSSSQNQQIFLNSFQTKATFCLNHIDKYVSLFCRTCDRLLCASCIIDGNHSNHSFCEMDHVAKEKQLQLREVVSNRGKEICEHVQNSIIVMKQEKGSVTEMCKTVSEEIAKQKTTLIQKIERWNEDLQTKLRDYQTVKVGCLSDRMIQADTCLTLLKVFLENPDSMDAFEKRKSIQILEIVHNITNPSKGLEVNPVSFLPGSGLCERELHTLFGSLAGVSCETSASDNTEDIIPQGNSVCVDAGEKVDSDQDSTDTESLYEDVVGSETMYKCAKSPIDRIAPVDINSSFIVTENKLYLVDFSKHKGDIEKEEPLMTGVVHITPVTEKGIYVQQEGIQSQVVTRVTTTGKLYRFLDCGSETLKCVGVSNSGQVIIYTEKKVTEYNGSYNESKTIRDFSIYNQNGTYNESIFETCSNWYFTTIDIVTTMSALYILKSTRSVPSKCSNNSGTVTNLLGDSKCRNYRGAIGKDPASQFHPRGLCQDKDGRLVVTDYWNHAVHLLTPEGKFSKFLMREEDGLAYPTAVAMDNYRHLWIGQCDGTIHIIKYIP